MVTNLGLNTKPLHTLGASADNESTKITIMKKVNKQCLLDTPRTVRVSEKTWQVIVHTRRP